MMFNVNKRDKDRERRRQRRNEAADSHNFVCVACGCTDVITAEGHHIAGRLFDNHVEYFCANCHRRLTEARNSHPKASCKAPGKVECAGHYCLGFADIFALTVRMAEDFGNRLMQLADRSEVTGDSAKSLTREAGHFLMALAHVRERVGQRLERHGHALIDEAKATAEDGK